MRRESKLTVFSAFSYLSVSLTVTFMNLNYERFVQISLQPEKESTQTSVRKFCNWSMRSNFKKRFSVCVLTIESDQTCKYPSKVNTSLIFVTEKRKQRHWFVIWNLIFALPFPYSIIIMLLTQKFNYFPVKKKKKSITSSLPSWCDVHVCGRPADGGGVFLGCALRCASACEERCGLLCLGVCRFRRAEL